MKNTPASIPENIKQSVSAIAPLVIVIILFIIVGKFGLPKVLEVRSEVVSTQKTEEILGQKLDLLKNLAPTVSIKTNLVSSALPDTSPSLAVSSQLKMLAANQGVLISNMKSSARTADKAGLNETSTSFTLNGGRQQIFSFLNEIGKIAPLTTVRKISLNSSAGGMSADINVVSFWAAYPTKLPAVTDPITDLTPTEKQILTDISSLIQPTFSDISASQSDLNPLPFGF